MADNQEVTLALIAHKIDTLAETVQRHCDRDEVHFEKLQATIDGNEDHPGLRVRIHELEHTQSTIKRVFWIVVTPILAGLGYTVIK